MMKVSITVLALIGSAYAYPTDMHEFVRRNPLALERAQAVMRDRQLEDTFNASTQHISTSGVHSFTPPRATDLRGPCPGLNALANHGYIPHDGYTTLHEVTDAVMHVYGMGSDLALFLATYAAVVDGDLTSWSIGGPPSQTQAAPAAGQTTLGQGLSQSHNILESDASPTRPDLYGVRKSTGVSPHDARVAHFETLLALQPTAATANYDIPLLASFRASRFHHSISNNPFFFNGPFTGLLVQPKSYTFMYRLMANHSREFPAGRLDQETLKSFFGISSSGPDGRLSYKPGHERIPSNWYRRSMANSYDNAFFLADALYMSSQHPEFLTVGGNVGGKLDSFQSVDLNRLTQGTYGTGAGNLYDFGCLAYQSAVAGAPSILHHSYADSELAMEVLRFATAPMIKELGCPEMKHFDQDVMTKFEGFNRGSSGSR